MFNILIKLSSCTSRYWTKRITKHLFKQLGIIWMIHFEQQSFVNINQKQLLALVYFWPLVCSKLPFRPSQTGEFCPTYSINNKSLGTKYLMQRQKKLKPSPWRFWNFIQSNKDHILKSFQKLKFYVKQRKSLLNKQIVVSLDHLPLIVKITGTCENRRPYSKLVFSPKVESPKVEMLKNEKKQPSKDRSRSRSKSRRHDRDRSKDRDRHRHRDSRDKHSKSSSKSKRRS